METIKAIFNLFFSQWTPEIQFKYTDLCNKFSPEEKENHLDSINLLAILLKIPGIDLISFQTLYEKYGLMKEVFLDQLPSNVLIHFWESLPNYICMNPLLSYTLNNLTPILYFDDSFKIFPHVIALSNPYLLNEFISKQSNQSLTKSLSYLFSSNNSELISKVFPLFLRKEPNYITLCIQPKLNEEVLASSLISNLTGKISLLNLADLVLLLKNGKIKQESKLFKALSIYIKKYFIFDLKLDNLTSNSLYDIVIQKYPELLNEKPFMDHVIKTIEEAKKIVENHQSDRIESFVNDLIGSGDCDEFNKCVASAAISGLIITYTIDKNLLIKLILLLKQIGIVEFPSFLTAKLLRKDPNQIDKISSLHPILSIASSFIKKKLNPYAEQLCADKPYQVVKALYILATFDPERQEIYNFPPDFQSFTSKFDFQNMKVPKKAPEYITKYKFTGASGSLESYYMGAFNDKSLKYRYFEIKEDFISRLTKIAQKYYPDFTYKDSKSNFSHQLDTPIPDEELYVTQIDGMDFPEDAFNSCLMSSLYNSAYTNTLNSVANNDEELEEYANIFMSTIGK